MDEKTIEELRGLVAGMNGQDLARAQDQFAEWCLGHADDIIAAAERCADVEWILEETVSELGSYQRQGMPPHITYGLFKHLAATLKGEDDGR